MLIVALVYLYLKQKNILLLINFFLIMLFSLYFLLFVIIIYYYYYLFWAEKTMWPCKYIQHDVEASCQRQAHCYSTISLAVGRCDYDWFVVKA